MHLSSLELTFYFTSYFLLTYANEIDSKKSDFVNVSFLLDGDMYTKNLTPSMKGKNNRTSIVRKFDEENFGNNSLKETNVYGPTTDILSIVRPINNHMRDSNEIIENSQPSKKVQRINWSFDEVKTVSIESFPENMDKNIFSADGNWTHFSNTTTDYFEAPSMHDSINHSSKDLPQNTATSKLKSLPEFMSSNNYDLQEQLLIMPGIRMSEAELLDSPRDESSNDNLKEIVNLSPRINSSEYTEENSSIKQNEDTENNAKTKEKMILKNDEDFDMEFERLFEDLGDFGNDVNHNEPKVSNRHPKSVDLTSGFDDLDVLEHSELIHEKYKSPGVESAPLVVGGKTFRNKIGSSISTPSTYNYFRTSYLLTSDVEINEEPFILSNKSDSFKTSQLELQDDLLNNTSTHKAAVSRLASDQMLYVLPSLTVELAEGNSLWMTPNVLQDLNYEVTNNLKNSISIRFKVSDEKSMLYSMDKYNVDLIPRGSTKVRLTLIPKIDAESDRIMFNAIGSEVVTKEAIVHVSRNYQSDTTQPDVDYSYTSDCTDVGLAECHSGTWTIKISARDQESGLMLLTTNPKGLHFPNGYTAGTTEEVTGYFSDSCCNPDLQIIAVDTVNNRVVKKANAYKAPLSFWAIIAIVLVSLIILVIIIGSIIYCVVKCKKKEEGSFDLPTYLGRSRY